jgi:predicted MFS family arabinose efflux permease
VKEHLHSSERGYGLVLGALGLGGVLGAWILKRVRDVIAPRVLVPMSFAVYALASLGVSLAPSLPIAVIVMVPAGIGWLCAFSTLNGLVQIVSPQWVRSRSVALYYLSFYVLWAVGAFFGGLIAEHIGAARTMQLAAVLTFLSCAAIMMLRFPTYADDADASRTPTPLPAE